MMPSGEGVFDIQFSSSKLPRFFKEGITRGGKLTNMFLIMV